LRKRWCKHHRAVSDGQLRGAHARNLLPIELLTETLLLQELPKVAYEATTLKNTRIGVQNRYQRKWTASRTSVENNRIFA